MYLLRYSYDIRYHGIVYNKTAIKVDTKLYLVISVQTHCPFQPVISQNSILYISNSAKFIESQ